MTGPLTCSAGSVAASEPLAGTATRAHTWVVVEHPGGWGQADLARSAGGVRVVLARAAGERDHIQRSRPDPPQGRTRVWVARVDGAASLRVGELAAPGAVADWDLAAVAAGGWSDFGRPCADPLLLVCANGRRDRCCGFAGGRLARQLWTGADAACVLTSSHLGGHRFAPTALLLPWGAMHGRLSVEAAADLLPQARAGGTPTASLRGFTSLSQLEQAAEAHVRRASGYLGLAPLPTRVGPSEPDGSTVVLVGRPGGAGTVPVLLQATTRRLVTSCAQPAEDVVGWSVLGTR